MGKFLTADPAQDGLNWYVYCGNNPILHTDPTGMRMAVGSTMEDEDDTVEGQHVWTGDAIYDVNHAAVETTIEHGREDDPKDHFWIHAGYWTYP